VLWSLAYLVVRRLFELMMLCCRSPRSKELEILVLRHELSILRRHAQRVGAENSVRGSVTELAPCCCSDSSRRRQRSILSAPPSMSFTRARLSDRAECGKGGQARRARAESGTRFDAEPRRAAAPRTPSRLIVGGPRSDVDT
jgi:hypothetical protein